MEKPLRKSSAVLITGMMRPLVLHGALFAAEFESIRHELNRLAAKTISGVEDDCLITGEEAAKYLGISYSEFRKMLHIGKMPLKRHKIGSKTLRFSKRELLAYIEQGSLENVPATATL